ncbi:MAG: OsmC family protein, partial [Actinobacteria bacterium]|nr:OsmC family protein [Actinomycetota bacterium]
HGFYGAMQEMEHQQAHVFDADHPAVLVGNDQAPTPVEFLLHALAACLTAGIANIAAARKVNLTRVQSIVEGDIDLLGILGLSSEVRNGYQGIKVSFQLEGDDPAKLREVVEQSRARSAVYDVLTNGVPVSIEVDAR